MTYKPKKIAKMTLERLEKHGDNIYDGLTPSAPSNIIDTNRALETLQVKNILDQKYVDKIELSKRLMDIDTEIFSINKDTANKLIDYIEQSGMDAIPELNNELEIKIDEYTIMVKDIKELDEEDFLSPIDYKRAVLHRIKEAKEFHGKIDYIKMILKTMENFESETMEVPQSKQFDFSFTNENANFYGASKMK